MFPRGRAFPSRQTSGSQPRQCISSWPIVPSRDISASFSRRSSANVDRLVYRFHRSAAQRKRITVSTRRNDAFFQPLPPNPLKNTARSFDSFLSSHFCPLIHRIYIYIYLFFSKPVNRDKYIYMEKKLEKLFDRSNSIFGAGKAVVATLTSSVGRCPGKYMGDISICMKEG